VNQRRVRCGYHCPHLLVNNFITLYRVQYSEEFLKARPPRVPSWSDEALAYQNTLKATGRWFGESREEVEWYAKHEYFEAPVILAIELDRTEAEKYRVFNIPLKPGGRDTPENPRAFSARPESEFFLPETIAARAHPIPSDLSAAISAIEEKLINPVPVACRNMAEI